MLPVKTSGFFKKRIYFSHRGSTKTFLENTREAFDDAVLKGFSGLETDVRTTSDGHLVLCHDPSFERVGGPKTPIAELKRDDIAQLKLNHGGKAMFFSEFLPRYSQCNLILDIKPEQGERTIVALMKWITKDTSFFKEKTAFLLWDQQQEEMMKALFKDGNFFAQKRECWRAGIAILCGVPFLSGIKINKSYGIPPQVFNIPLYKNKYVDQFHNKGAFVIAYLPDSEQSLADAEEVGCDQFLIDDADLLTRARVDSQEKP